MVYGRLTTITGPMFAGKTSALLQGILQCNAESINRVLVIKHSSDARYSDDAVISSHSGVTFPCLTTKLLTTVLEKHNITRYNFTSVFIDEVQFFERSDVINFTNTVLSNGVDVTVAGINMNSKGDPYESVGWLMAKSDVVRSIAAVCAVCGDRATKTQKRVSTGREHDVGASDLYEPMCTEHWSPKL